MLDELARGGVYMNMPHHPSAAEQAVNADFFRLLFAYNDWANARVLTQAARASIEDYFAVVPGLSHGSLHGTLLHILDSEFGWRERWQGLAISPDLSDQDIPSLAALRERLTEEQQQLAPFLRDLVDADLDVPFSFEVAGGTSPERPLGHWMFHLVNHGTQFRSEAAIRLTQLELSPGHLDFSHFIWNR
jgi:uncharacterized damage-inducible protein DinB